jgi:opacity protein-like surface antigen
MNNHTDRTLKGVSLLKLGAEFKPDPSIAVRLGYNYQSAAYNEKGFRDTTLDSPGTYFSSTPDYVNWKGTNRITAGFGYRVNKVSFDIAYQYSMTKGMFYPFQPDVEFNDNGAWETNISTPSSLNFKRHQLLFTLGYTF